MAKTIEQIRKGCLEWQEENEKERCVVLIAGYENNEISLRLQGNYTNILTCLASVMADNNEFRKMITAALELLIDYKSQEE